MGAETKIEWADATASPWYGCTKIAPGCQNCYAADLSKRNPGTLGIWGDKGTRVKSKSFVRDMRRANKRGEQDGRMISLFPSLCDPFEDRPDLVPWRQEMFAVADECPWVRLILLTKRPQNVRRMWPHPNADIRSDPQYRSNVFLLTSISDQATADAMIPPLRECRDLVPVLGVSAEPLLAGIDLSPYVGNRECVNCGASFIAGGAAPCARCYTEDAGNIYGVQPYLDWVIIGGESGPHARPMHPEWARSLRDQCVAAGVPFFFKQWGEWVPWRSEHSASPPESFSPELVRLHVSGQFPAVSPQFSTRDERDDWLFRQCVNVARVGKKAAGRVLDGREWNEFPRLEPSHA